MSYQAEISRTNPTCFLFLVDHSTSMRDPITGLAENPKKSEFVAEAINKVLQSLIVSASKDLEIRRYYQIGVIGYGSEVKNVFQGDLASEDLVWVDDLYAHPLRIEDRIRILETEDEVSEEVVIKFPIWIDPEARGQTPMCEALRKAHEILSVWVEEHPESYPPTVINLTDGESNDGDARVPAEALKNLQTEDGNVVLLTVHASSNHYSEKIFFPESENELPDHFSKVMYKMCSPLTPNMTRTASELLGMEISSSARGMVYNADIAGIVQALEIGTRPANIP
jgi:uncharacterized protein YegL